MIILLIGILVLILQIYLSKKESKFLGLILPALNFLISVLLMCNTTALYIGVITFAFCNIFTLILLIVYSNLKKG
jgi:hypothetical protein